MTERQHLIRTLWHLSAQLTDPSVSAQKREFTNRALQFYAQKLKDLDDRSALQQYKS